MSAIQIHPLFELNPTDDQIYSDHLPLLLPVNTRTHHFEILSWNVLAKTPFQGVMPRQGWNDQAATERRYARIAQTIKAAIAQHNLGIIALQEVAIELMKPHLADLEAQGWQQYETENGIITLVNARLLGKHNEVPRTDHDRSQTIALQDHGNPTLFIHNIWGEYNFFPDTHEAKIAQLTAEKQHPQVPHVLIGDFNTRFAPLHTAADTNITTGAKPFFTQAEHGDQQVPDFPDGGFLLHHQGDDYQQMRTQMLDYNGNILPDEKRMLSQEQREHPAFNIPYPVITLDRDARMLEVDGEQVDCQAIQDSLTAQAKGKPTNLIVRPTYTASGQAGLCVRLDPNLYYDKSLIKKLVNFQPKATRSLEQGFGQDYQTVYVPQERIKAFQAQIRPKSLARPVLKTVAIAIGSVLGGALAGAIFGAVAGGGIGAIPGAVAGAFAGLKMALAFGGTCAAGMIVGGLATHQIIKHCSKPKPRHTRPFHELSELRLKAEEAQRLDEPLTKV